MAKWGEINCPRCAEADDLVQAAVAAREAQTGILQGSKPSKTNVLIAPKTSRSGVWISDAGRHPRRGRVMQWILLLIQMNASVADLHYVELYETLEQCTADLQEISPRLEPHEVMLCIEANN
jgi:hypothetical protein